MAKEKSVAPTTNAVKKEDVKKLGFFKRVKKWFREMRSELKKVIWPTPKETAKKTGGKKAMTLEPLRIDRTPGVLNEHRLITMR